MLSNDNVPRGEMGLARKLAAEELAVHRRNATFQALSLEERRVTIAKDVIDWLDAKKLTARSGVYLRTEALGSRVNGSTCTACAVGAIFACAVERADTVKLVGEASYDDEENDGMEYTPDSIREQLAPYFSQEQLALIESAFEKSSFGSDYVDNPDLLERAIDYTSGSASVRMRQIMKNIIRNNGTFIP